MNNILKPSYGVSRFYGEFDIAMYTEDVKNTTSNKTHTETLVRYVIQLSSSDLFYTYCI